MSLAKYGKIAMVKLQQNTVSGVFGKLSIAKNAETRYWEANKMFGVKWADVNLGIWISCFPSISVLVKVWHHMVEMIYSGLNVDGVILNPVNGQYLRNNCSNSRNILTSWHSFYWPILGILGHPLPYIIHKSFYWQRTVLKSVFISWKYFSVSERTIFWILSGHS